jgi:hypothetical protein
MAYIKPPVFVRKVFNPLAMRFGIGGSTALVVKRRSSGTAQEIPVLPVSHDGVKYVVSARGESDWVRNVRSAGRLELRRGGTSETYNAVEIPVSESAEVIAAYRAKAGRAVAGFWKRLPDPADHPTFRLDSD